MTPELAPCGPRTAPRGLRSPCSPHAMCRNCGLPAEPDEDKRLLSWVYRRSLTTAKMDARRLHWKNSKAIWLAIKQSKHEAAEAARPAKLKRQ
ncbi:Phosphorylated carbohydrates phosphatase [Hordeum vulgare]|nr:Phosphorylated carbohydrates phosphatase [Hordeum vulgare]